jgi:tetratricopeptide (TPR) repeat protein
MITAIDSTRLMRAFGVLAALLFVLGACTTTQVNQKRADRYFDQGEYASALSMYEHVMEEQGPTFDVYYSIGRCAVQLEQWDKAIEAFEEARALESSFPDTYEKLAYCYGRKGQADKREETWRALLRIVPNHPKAHLALASIEFDRANYDKSVEHYRTYLTAEPSDVMTRSSLSAALIAQKKHQAAISELKKALAIDPKCVLCHFNLGVAYMGASQPEKAERELIVVTSLEPANQDGWIYLAAVYVRLGNSPRAIETLAEATEYGFADWARVEADVDFRPILDDARYQELKTRKPPQAPASDLPADSPAAP